ncbi:MAG: hypothetical protein AAF639_00845 [Chloroflexota bacterium]
MKSLFSQTLSTTKMAVNTSAMLFVVRVPVRPYAAHPQTGVGIMGFDMPGFGVFGTHDGDAGYGDTGFVAIQGRNASGVC